MGGKCLLWFIGESFLSYDVRIFCPQVWQPPPRSSVPSSHRSPPNSRAVRRWSNHTRVRLTIKPKVHLFLLNKYISVYSFGFLRLHLVSCLKHFHMKMYFVFWNLFFYYFLKHYFHLVTKHPVKNKQTGEFHLKAIRLQMTTNFIWMFK